MTSSADRQFVTVQIFNEAQAKTEHRFDILDGRLDNIDKTLATIGYETRLNAHDTAHLQTSAYWGFAGLGILIAVVGIISPLIVEIFKEGRQAKKEKTQEQPQELSPKAREEVKQLIAEALRNSLSAGK